MRLRPVQHHRAVVVQSYADEAEAASVIRELEAAGFPLADISVIARDAPETRELEDAPEVVVVSRAKRGAVAGGAIGAVAGLLIGASAIALPGVGLVIAGPIAAALAGAGTGAVTGGMTGALIGLGVTEDEARYFDERLQAGDLLVTIAAGTREHEALQILEREPQASPATAGAEDVLPAPEPV